ncbi:MAG: hypothetical protein M1835_006634 [Candelina submexicana]|nr:MAG: hypothetical protein M1835_006634 [Candelina submexicana]
MEPVAAATRSFELLVLGLSTDEGLKELVRPECAVATALAQRTLSQSGLLVSVERERRVS